MQTERPGYETLWYRLFAALGVVVAAFPAAAASASGDGTDVRAAKPALMQLAQMNATRAINEARGGNYKKGMKKKKKNAM